MRTTIDQSHNVEPKIEAMIQSVENLQEAYAKALIVDRGELARAQAEGDVLAGHRALLDAFRTDVRPLCAKVRVDLGASPDPVAAFRAVGLRRAGGRRPRRRKGRRMDLTDSHDRKRACLRCR